MNGFPIADMSMPGGWSGHIQVITGATLGWPIHYPGLGTMWLELWTYDLSFMCAQAKGTKDKISIICLKCPMFLKLKFKFSRLWHYGFNKAFGFFSLGS
jgi:hypothetical protein